MKTLTLNLTNGRNAKINLLLILVLLFSVGAACKWNFGDKTASDENRSEQTKDDSDSKDADDSDDDKPTEKADASTGEVPSDNALQGLIKETMLDFNDAIDKGDFSDFYENISKPWKKQTSPEKLEKTFSSYIKNKVDLSEVKNLKADIIGEPKIKRELGFKMLNVEGTYDTSPQAIKFELKYLPEGEDWKLTSIFISPAK